MYSIVYNRIGQESTRYCNCDCVVPVYLFY